MSYQNYKNYQVTSSNSSKTEIKKENKISSEKIHKQGFFEKILTAIVFNKQESQVKLLSKNTGKGTSSTYEQITREVRNQQGKVLAQEKKHFISQVKTADQIHIAWKEMCSRIGLIRAAIMKNLIHPATRDFSYKALSMPDNKLTSLQKNTKTTIVKVQSEINKGGDKWVQVTRLCIPTADHQLLDGCIIQPKGDTNPPRKSDRPVMVMSQGNHMTYELAYETAKAYATKHNIDVILYNPRGVGLSLGKERTTRQAVTDCKAVIKYALKHHCKDNPQQLGVYGHSLGGGITASALKELTQSELNNGIGLYINHHSFSSLHSVVEGYTKIPKAVAKIALKLLGIHSLNSSKALKKHVLARHTIVVTAQHDEIIKGDAKLTPKGQAKVSVFIAKYFGHNEEEVYTTFSENDIEASLDKAYIESILEDSDFMDTVAAIVIENRKANAQSEQEKQEVEKLMSVGQGMIAVKIKMTLRDWIEDDKNMTPQDRTAIPKILKAIEQAESLRKEAQQMIDNYNKVIASWAHPSN